MDALASAWRKRERRLDTRNAMLRYQMRLCFDTKPPTWEEFFPPEDAPRIGEIEAEDISMFKLDVVMAQYGGVMPADRPKPQEPAEDEFTKKMWRLMGVSGVNGNA